MSRLLGNDPIAKARSFVHMDGDEAFYIEDRQDIEGILRENLEDRKDRQGFKGDDMHHVARIPLAVWTELEKVGIAGDADALKVWLNDPDNIRYRSHAGKI